MPAIQESQLKGTSQQRHLSRFTLMHRSAGAVFEAEKHKTSFAFGGRHFGESGGYSRAWRANLLADSPIFAGEESEESTDVLFGEEGKSPEPKM